MTPNAEAQPRVRVSGIPGSIKAIQNQLFLAGLATFLTLAPTGWNDDNSATFAGMMQPPAPAPRNAGDLAFAEKQLREALRANQWTAIFPINVSTRNGKLWISGRVGTNEIYNMVIDAALDTRVPFEDRLVIDTRAAHEAMGMPARSGEVAVPSPLLRGVMGPPPLMDWSTPGWAGWDPLAPGLNPVGWDWAWNPPAISYPPWWPALSQQRLTERRNSLQVLGPNAAANLDQRLNQLADPRGIPQNAVEMLLDRDGIAVLRGRVPNEFTSQEIAARAENLQGVSKVINLLTIDPNMADPASSDPDVNANIRPAPRNPPLNVNPQAAPQPPNPPKANADAQGAEVAEPIVVPPPPQPKPPLLVNPAQRAPQPQGVNPPAAPQDVDLTRALERAFQQQPGFAEEPIGINVVNGRAVLTGQVADVLVAMRYFHTARTFPGIREVDDQLRFPPPREGKENPLQTKGLPEDVLPYLKAQWERQGNEGIVIDTLVWPGGSEPLTVKATLKNPNDRPRLEAILKTMPVLRGFSVALEITPKP